ncbi:putative ATP-dependent helicase IRC3 [Mucor velutinosus]|uniref:ATP-dependent helicase IRC3 n=1 Tax=Mucor velutinosus TaxID=708070 RepID=A0AAN7DFM6_9FUNG|nr:putative ATP-dependent helicase IRC3 [Mucor velutinosus]
MEKKTKKGYLWIFDQQDKWDEVASSKISQLEEAQAAHLDWFDKHSTVNELLALRRPDLKRKRDAIPTTTIVATSQIVPSEDVAKESSELMDAESMNDKRTEDIVKQVDIQSLDAHKRAVDKAVMKRQMNDDSAHQTTTRKVDATESQAETVHKTNTITIPPSKVKPTAIIKPYTAPKAQPEKPKSRSFLDDYDEEDDQVQIVVSARKSSTVPKVKPPRPSVFPSRPEPQLSRSTPTKTISLTTNAKPSSTTTTPTTNASTYRSAFMNRLFKTSRPSLKKAALPSASLSTSSNAAATGNKATDTASPDNKRDSYSYHPTIITKRSSTASVRSISSSIHSTPIEASDIMPEPRFKRFKALQKLNQNPPAAVAAAAAAAAAVEQVTHDLSTVEEVDESSKSQSQLQQENQQGQQEYQQGQQETQGQNEDHSSQENAAAFVIPAWGEGDNLRNQLEKQANTNFYDFFGRLQPVDLKGK